MFVYTENDTESHRNIQNTNIQTKTHQTQENTCSNFEMYPFLKFHIKKKRVQNYQRFMYILMAFFIFYLFCIFCIFYTLLRATQPNQFMEKLVYLLRLYMAFGLRYINFSFDNHTSRSIPPEATGDHGRPREAADDHERPQIPRTDVWPARKLVL